MNGQSKTAIFPAKRKEEIIVKVTGDKRYYVYTHSLKETGAIFYVGFGDSHKSGYSRAVEAGVGKRNKHWTDLVLKINNQYTVTIEFEFDSRQDAITKEFEMIEELGRLCDGSGVLTNIANGGIDNTRRPSKINQYSTNGEFIKTWESIIDITSYLRCCDKTIYYAISREGSSSGYLWRWYEGNNKDIPPLSNKRVTWIKQYTKEGRLIAEYSNISQAAKATNIDRASINHCLLSTAGRKTCGGFIWSYKETEPKLPRPYKIVQYTKDGEFVRDYSYYSDIMKELKISSPTAIRNCFTGKQKQAYGFIWKKLGVEEAKRLGISGSRLQK